MANPPDSSQLWSPPNPTHFWSPTSIKIPNTPGQPDIELIGAFCPPTPVTAYTSVDDSTCVYFPITVYPPNWEEGRDKLYKAITLAAKTQANTILVRGSTKTNLNQHGEKVQFLKCNMSRPYKSHGFIKKRDEELQALAHASTSHMPQYIKDIRRDRPVNKDKAIRGDHKNHGKKLPRRRESSKPNLGSECMFSFKLCLKPGKYWRLSYSESKCGIHNHFQKTLGELNVSTSKLTSPERKMGNKLMTFGHSGTAKNIMLDMTGQNLTSQQVHHLGSQSLTKTKEKTPDKKPAPKLTATTKLMNHLRTENSNGTMRYVALYHEVTVSTLLTVKKFKESKKKKAEKKKEAANKKQRKDFPDQFSTPPPSQEQNLDDNDDLDLQTIPISLQICTPTGNGEEEKHPYILDSNSSKLALGETLASLSETLLVGQKVMLAVAWSREDERQLFEKFPEILMMDVTFGTNSETRPLCMTAGLDGNMNVFTPVRAFMPSQCQWVFDWIFSTALPRLMGSSLQRVQICLTDGDSKIYNAYDKTKDKNMPHSVHMLCIYHLVTQGLENIRPKLSGLGDIDVKNQIATFKHTLLSLMSTDGTETEEEYEYVTTKLKQWLGHWSNNKSVSVNIKKNAQVLEEFWTKRVEIHKDRWFFPRRKHLMTLGQKATSALEGQNSVMKSKASKKITPSMDLFTSFRTQNVQCKTRMDHYQKKIINAHTAKPRWTSSSSAKHICKLAESLLQTNYEEHDNYVCKTISPTEIHVVRSPKCMPFCTDCTDDIVCPVCSPTSPVCRIKRRRKIFIHPHDTIFNKFVVTCSCPYQATYGIPCRHVTKLLRVKKEHVFVRWHRDYAALYHRPGFEHLRSNFDKLLTDRRLIVDESEYKEMLVIANESMTNTDVQSISLFRHPFEVVQKDLHGVIPSRMFDDEHDRPEEYDHDSSLLAGSQLSQEVGNMEGIPNFHSHLQAHALITNNPFVNMNSQLQAICGMMEMTPRIMNHFENEFRTLVSKFSTKILLNSSTINNDSEFVSLCPELDTRSKYDRKKSATDPRNKRKRKYIESVVTTNLGIDSVDSNDK